LADRYTEKQGEKEREAERHIEEEIAPAVRSSGFYTKEQFLALCHWKTPRTQPRCATNDESWIREVTALALKTDCERLRIEVLTLLNGVGWPTASVLLHFGHSEHYPILDFRALSSLSIPEPRADYTFPFWRGYVEICRNLAAQCSVPMRTLDRALWRFSADESIK
jgi:hypothetical protein